MRSTAFVSVILAIAAVSAVACDNKVPEPTPAPQSERKPPVKDEFSQIDEVVGDGAEAKDGSKVKVQYTGTLKNGTKFDSSRDHGGDPLSFTIGKAEVIKGWEKGVTGMKVHGKRKLVIPSDLGYGDKGNPPKIPPKATLLFDIELVGVE